MTTFRQQRAPHPTRLIQAHPRHRQVTTANMWVWRAFIVIGWGLIVTSLCLLTWELVQWLHEGTWRSVSMAKMIRMPNLGQGPHQDWSGVEIVHSAFRWFGRMPAVLMLFVGGLICSWRANDLHAAAEAEVAQ